MNEKRNAYERERRRIRILKGVCVWCPALALPDSPYCLLCRDKARKAQRDSQRKRYERQRIERSHNNNG
jgi:uncharacterized OB-fold protein